MLCEKLKNNSLNLVINSKEGAYVRHIMNIKGYSLIKVGNIVNVGKDFVCRVLKGQKTSARVQAEIARILGHECWDDVVIEARLACSGNFQPAKSDIENLRQSIVENRKKNKAKAMEDFSKYIAERVQMAVGGA